MIFCIDSNETFLRSGISKNVEIIYVSQTFDLGTQGHTYFSYDLAYLRLYACYWLDLIVDYNVDDLREPKTIHSTLMVDLDFQGQTIFFKEFIFKVSPRSYIIFWVSQPRLC